jgi:hypothetical protein
MTSLLGSGRRCHLARVAAALASSLDFLQGTSEKIHLQGLLCQTLLQAMDFLALSRCVLGRDASCPGSTISSFLRHL